MNSPTPYAGAISIARLSIAAGISYHAARLQTCRSPFFERVEGTVLSSVILNEAGREKLAGISNRLPTRLQ